MVTINTTCNIILSLTKREYEIISVLWNSENPLTCHEIISVSNDSSWAHGTIYTKLEKLIEKGFVQIAGLKKINNRYIQQYTYKISASEYFQPIIASLSYETIHEITKKMIYANDLDLNTIIKSLRILKTAKLKK